MGFSATGGKKKYIYTVYNFAYSSPSSAEVRIEWIYNSAPRIRFHGVEREHLNLILFFEKLIIVIVYWNV